MKHWKPFTLGELCDDHGGGLEQGGGTKAGRENCLVGPTGATTAVEHFAKSTIPRRVKVLRLRLGLLLPHKYSHM